MFFFLWCYFNSFQGRAIQVLVMARAAWRDFPAGAGLVIITSPLYKNRSLWLQVSIKGAGVFRAFIENYG